MVLLGILVFVIAAVIGCNQFDRVDPGYVGVVIDYSDGGKVSQAPTGTWQFVGPYKKMIEYPVSQIQSVLARETNAKGETTEDDSINCPTKGGVQLRIDATLWWRADPEQITNLYFRQPGIPLYGSKGMDVDSRVVRTALSALVGQVCGDYVWEDVYAIKKNEVQDKIRREVSRTLSEQFLKVDDFFLGAVSLPPKQQEQAAELIAAQQAARVAALTKDKIEAEAAANRAKVEAEAATSLAKTQAEAKIAIAISERDSATAKINADREASTAKINADREASVLKTQAEAAALAAQRRAEGEAQASKVSTEQSAANKRTLAEAEALYERSVGLAKASVEIEMSRAATPDRVALERAKKWTGQEVPGQQIVVPPGYSPLAR